MTRLQYFRRVIKLILSGRQFYVLLLPLSFLVGSCLALSIRLVNLPINSPLAAEGIKVANRKGEAVESKILISKNDGGKYSYKVDNKFAKLQVNNSLSNPEETKNFIFTDTPAEEDRNLVTSVLFVDDSEFSFESADITLKKTKDSPINAILTCPSWDFDEEKGTCGKWQIADITPTIDKDSISFNVTHFSAYAGAYLEILDVQSNLTVGDRWEVRFNTYGTSDLSIEAIEGTTYGTDVEFIEFYCGDTKYDSSIYDNGKISIPNYSCEGQTSKLVNKAVTPGIHTLQFTYGESVEIAKNFACDVGTLDTTCEVSTSQVMADASTISGTGNLTIKGTGILSTAAGQFFSIAMGGIVTIESGGTITGNLTSLTAANLDVQLGGSINVNGKGYASSTGPGEGNNGGYESGGGGAGYGGAGGNGEAGVLGGVINGEYDLPTALGSGGGVGNIAAGGAGGGAVIINITGTTTIAGSITANGGNGSINSNPSAGGGGSGGTISITTGTLTGAGSITATGGTGGNANNADGGGGGGGRIALYYTDKTGYSGTVQAVAGTGPDSAKDGAPGTIYEKPTGQTYGNIKFDNLTRAYETSAQLATGAYTFNTITITGNTYMAIPDGLTIEITNLFNLTGNYYIANESTTGVITYPTPFDLATTGTNTIIGGTAKWAMRDVTVSSGTLSLSGNYALRDVVIQTGSTLTHQANGSTPVYDLNLTVSGDLTINGTGSINVSGKGYGSSSGPGEGNNGPYDSGGGGGGYGGAGGNGEAGVLGGIVNGEATQPTSLGSGGGIGSSAAGGAGGGAIIIDVSGTTTIGGSIISTGATGSISSNNSAGGGGSGGTISLITTTLAGAGSITANGGTGGNANNADGGGGGGGRILVFTGSSTYTGTISVTGGFGPDGAADGAVGTTYIDYTSPTSSINAICDIVGNGCTASGIIASPQEAYSVTSITGTAGESDTSLESIQLAIKDTTDNDWYSNLTGAFGEGTETFFNATSLDQSLPYTGTVNWSYDSSSVPWEIDHIYEIKVAGSNPHFTGYSTLGFMFSNSPPTVSNVTASQNSSGHVDITYDVTDVESSSTTIYLVYDVGTTLGSDMDTGTGDILISDGTYFPNAGTIIVGNEFVTYTSKSSNTLTGTITRGALNTTTVSHTTGDTVWLLASGGTGNVGSVTNGTGKSVDWTAKTDQDGLDYALMKVRLIANDGASSAMVGSDQSIAFVIDVKDPVFPANFRIDASLATPLIYIPCTDESTLQMKLGTASDLAGSSLVAQAGSINFTNAGITFANGMTVYGLCQDPYSNATAIQTAVIPGVPSNMFYQDVSNVAEAEWQEFIAWGVIDATSITFDSYKIYRSVDGGAFSLRTTIGSRSTNYYVDQGLTSGSEYSYKITSGDVNGNISAYSAVVTDTPDGTGGTDLSQPTISGVAVGSITATQATISWTTNKYSNSTVYLEAASIYPGSNRADYDESQGAPSVVISHSVILSGLTPNTEYSFLVESTDASDNIATGSSSSYQFTTLSGPNITNVSVTRVFDSVADISWKTTGTPSTSYVIYSKNADLSAPTLTEGSDDLGENHEITLTGLDIGTTYYFYVRSTDGSSNITEDKNVVNGSVQYYDLSTTVDETDPTISSVEVKLTGETGATITWLTDEEATSTVNWGLTSSLGQTTQITNVYTTYHSISLTGLTKNTLYYYRVKSIDRSSNETVASIASFTTNEATTVEVEVPITDESLESQVADSIASLVESAGETVLKAVLAALAENENLADISEDTLTDYLLDISDKTFSGPTISGSNLAVEAQSTAASVSWITSSPANSLIAYVKDSEYDANSSNPYKIEAGDSSASVTEHTVTLDGLEPETTYHAQVRSKGSFGPSSSSSDIVFATASLTAAIDNIQVTQTSESSVNLVWETTIPTKSKINILDITTGEATTHESPNFLKNHSFGTDELNPSTDYTAQVISIDEGNKETESPVVPFSTVLNTSPPEISDVRVVTSLIPGKVEQVQTIISWKTNKPSTSKVLYDEGVQSDGELRFAIPEDTTLRREHITISSSFSPGKVYSYKVESVDAGGNPGTSESYTLLTPQPQESVVDLIVNNLEDMFGFLR